MHIKARAGKEKKGKSYTLDRPMKSPLIKALDKPSNITQSDTTPFNN